ncbi:uncharacterized protein LOC123872370 [Maniola jurtina]|uniref:uncharacterized protein LOC123872370 n=1 Tax=Maniola jurtina TaxID=191418 RepID=UPI001E687E09|nr:uncharacterized protein LOC123872370 [Maniola jurtina]
MGGCRCTYRNCKIKSDGKTHMFHFPVFDKVRCHQWLVNAQRLDFLDLKVSQLKNRCVCQHHFKEESFMNFKKDKLTFEAVPTINGPFCDPSKEGLREPKTYTNPILLEDIENDFDINDKKSNFSLKYADFLTNSEFVDSSARYNRNNISQIKDNTGTNLKSSNVTDKDNTSLELHNTRLQLPTKKIRKVVPQQMMAVPLYSDFSNELKMGKELNLEQNLTDLQPNVNLQDKNSKSKLINVSSSAQSVDIAPKSNQDLSNEPKMGIELNLEQNLTDPLSNLNLEDKNCQQECNIPVITPIQSVESVDATSKSKQVFPTKRPKVKILSEKRIKDPINIGHIAGKFEMISPSRPLSWRDKRNILPKAQEPEIIPETLTIESDIKPSEKLKVLEVLDVQFDPIIAKADPVQQDQNKAITGKIEINTPQSPPKKKSTPTKNKVTPERSAVIEKKRKFNMKLKDIIESCLDKLDDPLKNYEVSPSLINDFKKPPVNSVKDDTEALVKRKTKQQAEKAVVSHLAENKSLPSVQEYTIAYLEERMKKMESTLLNKIAQNSQEIIDFKNAITKDSSQVVKKCKEQCNKRKASTQTNENESSYKKFLYQEISKYLSPGSNSIIYEELFMNKFSCDKVLQRKTHPSKESPSKKKRRRCI